MKQNKENKGWPIPMRGWMAGALALTVVAAMGVIAWLNRPAEGGPAEAPKAAAAGDTVRAADGCELVQTLHYGRCGHTLTRRVNVPPEVVGMTLEEVTPLYPDWQITEFGPKEIHMSWSPELFCPDHMVLMPNNAGLLCVFQNRYGDAMALVTELETELGSLPPDVQEEVRRGMGFDTLEALEQWLESVES